MINGEYIECAESIKGVIEKNSISRFDAFLGKSAHEKLLVELKKCKGIKKYIPTRYSYETLNYTIPLLKEALQDFFSKAYKKRVSFSLSIKKFSHKEYTIMSDDDSVKKETKFYLFIGDSWNKKWGGRKIIVREGETTFVVPQKNSLVVVNKTKRTRSFIEYINSGAKNKVFFVISATIRL